MAIAITNLEKRKINILNYKNFIKFIFINYFFLNIPAYCADNGKILAYAAGCYGCHTSNNNTPFSGGYKIKTKYGIFISPNITFDSMNGIGNWDFKSFSKAIAHGIGPNGKPYYPVLPYKWYKDLSTKDSLDIFNYIKSIPQSSIKQKPHNLYFPYNIRKFLWIRRILEEKLFKSQIPVIKNKVISEGAYLVKNVGHCGACHSPRTIFSIVKNINDLSGRPKSNNNLNDGAPNISNNFNKGIGSWDELDIVFFLKNGFKPNGDYVESHMSSIIENGTSYLNENQLYAIAKYLLSNYNK